MMGPERTKAVAEVVDGRDVDHADPQRARRSGAQCGGPFVEVRCLGEDPARVIDDRGRVGQRHPPSAAPLEELDAESALQLGQTLAHRALAGPQRRCRLCPRGVVHGGDEVLQLGHGDVGEGGKVQDRCITHQS